MSDDITTRLQRIEDRAELWELVSRYGVAVDDEDYDTLRQLFAADATFGGLNGSQNQGRDGVVAYLKERADNAHDVRVHTPTSQYFDHLADQEAAGTVVCYAALFSGPERTFFSFRYDDRYVREDGRWKFASRRVHHQVVITPEPAPAS